MYALKFDDFKRKVAPQGVQLNKLITCFPGTDDYDAWMAVFLQPENDTVDILIEDDYSTTTFYTTKITKTKEMTA
jgi:hypothetical protein